MRDIKSLKENEVIHCETEEEAKAICKLFHEAGKRWGDGNSYLDFAGWHVFGGNTCYSSYGQFCNKEHYLSEGKTIIPAFEFLWTPTNGEMIEVSSNEFRTVCEVRFIGMDEEFYVGYDDNTEMYDGWLYARPLSKEIIIDFMAYKVSSEQLEKIKEILR